VTPGGDLTSAGCAVKFAPSGPRHDRGVALNEDPSLAGIVFRRLTAPDERSRADLMLHGGGPAYRSPRLAGDEAWYGLCDLAGSTGAELAAAAAACRLSARVLEVRAMAMPAGGAGAALRGRLVRELADVCRAQGVQWMVAGAAGVEAVAVDLLRGGGFTPAEATRLGLSDPGSTVWLAVEV
jgi:hypothetical protein